MGVTKAVMGRVARCAVVRVFDELGDEATAGSLVVAARVLTDWQKGAV